MKLKKRFIVTLTFILMLGFISASVESKAEDKDENTYDVAQESNTDYVQLNETNFPDDVFREYLSSEFDEDGDTWVYVPDVKYISCEGEWEKEVDNCIKTVKGVEYFTYLEVLYVDYNEITEIDLSKNVNLLSFDCYDNKLTELDISNNINLENLSCGRNEITDLNIEKNKNLKSLYCQDNKLTHIDVSSATTLEFLGCNNNDITSLDLSSCKESLQILSCRSNDITYLSLANMSNLYGLEISVDSLECLDISNTKLGFGGIDSGIEMVSDIGNGKFDTSIIIGLDTMEGSKPLAGKMLTYSHGDSEKLEDGTEYGGYYYAEFENYPDDANLNLYYYYKEFAYDNDDTTEVPDDAEAPNTQGIYVSKMDRTGITAGVVTQGNKEYAEYSWWACEGNSEQWFLIQDWTLGSEWLNWTPDKFGDYVIVGKVRLYDQPNTECSSYINISYHPQIKGKCQMPYTGEGGGYLIGVESYENPNQSYMYEMLVLDCTLLAEGKDAWIYTTGKFSVPEGNAAWTVWQPQYGYYWTLFRVYDAQGNLLDEQCYGFVNAY